MVLFALGRSAYYPFWAMNAAEDALARSWGGPSPVGATLVHWAVAAALAGLGWGLLRAGRTLRRPRNSPMQ
jgi:hypothetical protein